MSQGQLVLTLMPIIQLLSWRTIIKLMRQRKTILINMGVFQTRCGACMARTVCILSFFHIAGGINNYGISPGASNLVETLGTCPYR